MTMLLTRWGGVLVTGAILLVVNLLATGWFFRLDLTEDKEFTISSSTRGLLKELDDKLLVRGYFTRDLPPPYNRMRDRVRDLLDEYDSVSGGKVTYEFIDPADEGPSPETRMMTRGIPQVQVTDVSSDQVQVKNGFMGIEVKFEDRTEVIPVVQTTQGLEFLLTGKIRKLTGTGRGKVGILTGYGAIDDGERMGRIAEAIREQYDLVPVDLEGEIPEGTAVMLVAAPVEPLSDWALSRLDGFLAGGRAIGIFAGRADVNLQNQVANPIADPFAGTLATWGVAVGDDMVADARNMRITVQQRRGIFTMQNLVDYPYIPAVTALDTRHPIVSGLEGIFLPFVSTVRTHEVDGITHTVLARSSPNSWQVSSPYSVDPFQRLDMAIGPQAIRGPHPLAVASEGTFPSHWAGRTVTRPGEDGEGVTIDAPTSAPGRLLVAGTGVLLEEQYLMNGENLPFLMNAIDWLTGDESLIALRSRGATERPLREVSDGARNLIKLINLLLGPVLLVAAGLIHWRLRQARRRKLEASL